MYTVRLNLVSVSRGCYKRPPEEYYFPPRAKKLAPAAAVVWNRILNTFTGRGGHYGAGIVLSDMWRSAMGSLRARAAKTGVQLPGYSGHNFGVSIDVDIESTLTLSGITWKTFYERMLEVGATPYARDCKARDYEAWHWNLLDLPSRRLPWGTKGKDVEEWISSGAGYGSTLLLDPGGASYWREAQRGLAELGLYPADGIDGIPGRQTQAALELLRTMAKLSGSRRGDGLKLSSCERRVLAFAAATIEIT